MRTVLEGGRSSVVCVDTSFSLATQCQLALTLVQLPRAPRISSKHSVKEERCHSRSASSNPRSLHRLPGALRPSILLDHGPAMPGKPFSCGFARTYISPECSTRRCKPDHSPARGGFSCWILLLVTQTSLVSAGPGHPSPLGIAGFLLRVSW